MIPEKLKHARRQLDFVSGIEILDDFKLLAASSKYANHWLLRLAVNINSSNVNLVPNRTEWYLIVNETYPLGEIDIYPSSINSISSTFPHQLYNTAQEEFPWKTGKLCLSSPEGIGRLRGFDPEPRNAINRMKWNVERTKDWLVRASQNTLIQPGDLYELPDFSEGNPLIHFVYFEDGNTFKPIPPLAYSAVVSVHKPNKINSIFVFRRQNNNEKLLEADVQSLAGIESDEVIKAIVVPINREPVLPPFKTPQVWSELEKALIDQGIELWKLIKDILPQIRAQSKHVLLFVWPIPHRVGESSNRWHWQPLILPKLSNSSSVMPNGFKRRNERNYQWRDRHHVLRKGKKLNWIKSENWAAGDLLGRGCLCNMLRDMKVSIIGLGALGSSIAELLVRGGVQNLILIDNDTVQVGNLVRHTLGSASIGLPKAPCVAARLKNILPDVSIEAFYENVLSAKKSWKDKLLHSDLILETTGNDDVIAWLGEQKVKEGCVLGSCSIGIYGRRIYFALQSDGFNVNQFLSSVNPYLADDCKDIEPDELPRDGLGCWHPTFPAACSDLWLAASICTKTLDELIKTSLNNQIIYVWELDQDELGIPSYKSKRLK